MARETITVEADNPKQGMTVAELRDFVNRIDGAYPASRVRVRTTGWSGNLRSIAVTTGDEQ